MNIKQIIHTWYGFNPRERWMTSIGAGILFFALVYALLYAPLQDAVIKKQEALKNQQEVLAWINHVRKRPHSTTKLKAASPTQLLSVITQSLTHPPFSSYAYALEQSSVNNIDLKFKNVPFNRFMDWAWKLNQQYAFDIKQLHAEKADREGMVKLTCIISSQ